MLTQERLREILYYNGKFGIFVWKESRGRVKAGDIAGTNDHELYRLIRIDSKFYKAHRLVFLYLYGRMPLHQVDHINGNPSDNRLKNLREVDNQENHKNIKIGTRNKSGIIGVFWNEPHKRWVANISVNKRSKRIYRGEDFFEACCIRKSAELKHGFHPNHGRK